MISTLARINLKWRTHYRIIPSKFPPINFFETLVDAELMQEVFELESLTNDRLRDDVGDISLVAPEDRIAGVGSSIVMASFTHPAVSRFSRGDFGVYYASKTLATAITETVYHTEKFLSYTNEPPSCHVKRVYQGKKILSPLVDIRHPSFHALHDSNNMHAPRQFGSEIKKNNDWGILYNSVRHQKGECIAIFRPNALELPINQTRHLQYHWNGNKITRVLELGEIVLL